MRISLGISSNCNSGNTRGSGDGEVVGASMDLEINRTLVVGRVLLTAKFDRDSQIDH